MDEDEYLTTLLNMGFENVDNIKKALRLSKNDINEAVAILTNEHSDYAVQSEEFEMQVEEQDYHSHSAKKSYSSRREWRKSGKEMYSDVRDLVYNFVPIVAPPPYETLTDKEMQSDDVQVSTCTSTTSDSPPDSSVFPTTNLYELESRVFTDRWSIPYKKDESLGKCLLYATKLAEAGACEDDENCKRFLEYCLPEAFNKLLTSGAVRGWAHEVHEGVKTMLHMFIHLVIARLKYDPVSVPLLQVLEKVFDPETEFNARNKSKVCLMVDMLHVVPFATSKSVTDSYGWLVDLIHKFGQMGGFKEVQNRFTSSSITGLGMAALLSPFAKCAEFLNPSKVCPLLNPCMDVAVMYIRSLSDDIIKSKDVFSISELLNAMRMLCLQLYPPQVTLANALGLEVILRMLKCPHFNARMNGLKEVTKLIDLSECLTPSKAVISSTDLLDWLTENKVLSIGLEGNIDQVQYTDKIKMIIEFIGKRLSIEELTKIWNMQNGQNAQFVDNIHAIVTAASMKFQSEHFDHLLTLVEGIWDSSSDQMKKRLTDFIGRIGKETNQGRNSTKILDLLWSLSHSSALSSNLIEHVLEEHFSILSTVPHPEEVKKCYCVKCIEDISKETLVLPSIKLLHAICKHMLTSGDFKNDKEALDDLNKTYDLVKLTAVSLVRCHRLAVAVAGDGGLHLGIIVTNRYTHEEFLLEHLNFLQFVLKDGTTYLPWDRAEDIWDCLVSNPSACEGDRETCYEWFTNCLQDLEISTQSLLFQRKLLKLEPTFLTGRAFHCFTNYFESVNSSEHKLKKSTMVVEKLDLTGADFLWQVALSSEENIANTAIQYLLEISYHALTPRLKNDLVSLHKRFISECYKRLEAVGGDLGQTAIFAAMSNATKTLTSMSVSEASSYSVSGCSTKYQNICRLLQIAKRYISSIEETFASPRTILPHGTFFLGYPMFLRIQLESTKEEYIVVTHSNESLGSVKNRISQHLNKPASQMQMSYTIDLPKDKNQCLIGQFFQIDQHLINVRDPSSNVMKGRCRRVIEPHASNSEADALLDALLKEKVENHKAMKLQATFLLENEKKLPGFIMAGGGEVFDMLYKLAALDDPRIALEVRSLIHIIPTDQAVLDALDAISVKRVTEIPSPTEVVPRSSPRSPKKFTVTTTSKEKVDGPKEILANLFDPSTPNVTPFKLLYNLEVLSGKLMPVIEDAGTIQSAQIFCKDFLAVGGLKLIFKVLEIDSIPNNVNYCIHQACYLTAIDIARFLLCNQTGLETDNVISFVPFFTVYSWKNAVIGFPSHTETLVSSAFEDQNVSQPIKVLNCDELLEMMLSLMRVAWAAAAGNLHLANSPLPNKEGHFYGGRRSQQGSTGSTDSIGSDSGDHCALHGGVCGQQPMVSDIDSLLSRKALKFLVHCIHLRPDVFTLFSKLHCIRDFTIDLLLGSPSPEVRFCALEEFYSLSQLHAACYPSPKHYMLQILLKAHLPLWVTWSCIRGTNQRLLNQCREYFELVCKLLDGLSHPEQEILNIDAKQMVEDEITWLQGFSPSSSTSLCSTDSALMTGHFKLVKTLLRCDGVLKKEVGEVLIPDLLQNFLFPASHMISEGTTNIANELSPSFTPKCTTLESRIAAYDVLVELATGCIENLTIIGKRLLSMHHCFKMELAKEFDYEPLVAGRAECGYVGLKNAGATCYMNSVLQQLFMQPGVKEFILSVDKENVDEESLFYQFQTVFGHLLESRLEYHVPENFWKCFRLWGEPINVREQQDAFEFFTHLIDQIDEYLIKNEWEPVFKEKFEGLFSDQKICQGCPHRYEREESFMALNLPIKSHNLLDSLDQFVKGELLEGHNAYFCEKCQEKRNTIKRTCIKKLPPVLVIQLKRFDYDWEANRALKFDDYFKFPWQLDMLPYTTEGMQELEMMDHDDEMNDNQVVPTIHSTQKMGITSYDLVGVIVHSGQANAGHYYSYIKERRLDSGKNFNKWFKFNDTTVEEVAMSNAMIESECFGGTYKAKVQDSGNSGPEIRQRYWNGYLLFYEKTEEPVKTPRTPRKTPNKFSFRKSENDALSAVSRNLFKTSPSVEGNPYRQRDSLSQLTQLVDQGERQGLFLNKMPVRIHQVVREENLLFMHNSNVYNESYFNFVFQLVRANTTDMKSPHFVSCATTSLLPLSIGFLFNTYLRYKNKNSAVMNEWMNLIESIISSCKESAFMFIKLLGSAVGLSYMKPFLLECSNREVRQIFSRIVEKGITYFFSHGGKTGSVCLNDIINHLLEMLNQDVPDNCRNCSQYFSLLCTYAQLGTKTCGHLLVNNAFRKFLTFLLGPGGADMENMDSFPRRWSPLQTQDFGSLHATMALLILNCNLMPKRTCDPENFPVLQSVWATSETAIAMPSEIAAALYHYGAHRYIQEVVSACREVGGSISVLIDMLIQCSFCNEHFSTLVISQVMHQYSSVPSNELKNLSCLLLEILCIEDPLQFTRLRYVIDGCLDDNNYSFNGITVIVRSNQSNDSRRSYQGVKFLVNLAQKSGVAKEYLTPSKLQWSVNWLKKRMADRSSLSVPFLSNDDSNTKIFQRTLSAQNTLDEATALLTGVEAEAEQENVDDKPAADIDYKIFVAMDEEHTTKISRKNCRRLKRVQAMDNLDLDSIDY